MEIVKSGRVGMNSTSEIKKDQPSSLSKGERKKG